MLYLNKFIVALVLLVPVSIGAFNPAAEVLAAVAFVLSLVAMPFVLTQWSAVSNSVRKLIVLLAIYYGIGLIGLFLNGIDNVATHNALGTTGHFIIVIPILVVMQVTNVDEKWFWSAVIAGAISNGCYSLFLEQRGSINPILYGDISIFLAFASLMAWRLHPASTIVKGLALLGFILGGIASFYSLSRGSWIAIPGFFIIFALYLYLSIPNNSKRIQLFVGALVLLVAVAWFNYDKVVHRLNVGIEDVVDYQNSGHYTSSVGYRLEVYKGAIEVIRRNPVFGIGLGSEMNAINKLAQEGNVEDVSYLTNVHNQILQEGVSKGLLGIFSYFILMGYLLYIFLIGMLKSPKFREVHTVGVLMIAGYFIFGLTNITFTHGVFNTFFVCMLALMLSVKGLLKDFDAKVSQ